MHPNGSVDIVYRTISITIKLKVHALNESAVDIDFNNAAGFSGTIATLNEGHYVAYFLSHSLMFCQAALLEAHVLLTAASCIFGERSKFDVYAGTHTFIEFSGVAREVQHFCIHRKYNHTFRWDHCAPDNLALLVLNQQFYFNRREDGSEFIVNRIRYGTLETDKLEDFNTKRGCKFYGWGSRRNGYLIPLLLQLYKVEVSLLSRDKCLEMWNYDNKFLCLSRPQCKSEKHGALCPDDVGSVLTCQGYLRGIMVSSLIDRPCGTGFLDLTKFHKFLTCGVDDSRDVLNNDDYQNIDYTQPPTPAVKVASLTNNTNVNLFL